MLQFLLDTDICIYFTKKLFGLAERLRAQGLDKCAISEITYAELLYGAANSQMPLKNAEAVELFIVDLEVIPISSAIPIFAREKSRLRRIGKPLEDFDLLIGATAINHDLTLVTNNTRHFNRLQGIKLEDWTK